MVTVTESGGCQFRMYMPHAGSVGLLGSFCKWQLEADAGPGSEEGASGGAVELERDADGWWIARLDLPPGDHEFCYLVDGRNWMPDYAAGGVRRDSSGRWVSLINVPAGARAETRPVGALAEPRIERAGDTRESRRQFARA